MNGCPWKNYLQSGFRATSPIDTTLWLRNLERTTSYKERKKIVMKEKKNQETKYLLTNACGTHKLTEGHLEHFPKKSFHPRTDPTHLGRAGRSNFPSTGYKLPFSFRGYGEEDSNGYCFLKKLLLLW